MKSVSIIVKPGYACNASCMHCSVTGNSHSVLSPQGVSKSIKNIVIFAEKYSGETIGAINIILHGGEPMLLGTSYVNRMVGSLEDELPSVRCDYAIQTNLLAYTSHWKTLFEKVFAWKVSSSYDFFSSFRKTKDGRNYFDTWYDKVKQYQDDSGKRLYTICVLSRENVEYVEDIIREAYYLGLDIKLNYLYPAGRAIDIDKKVHLSLKKFR